MTSKRVKILGICGSPRRMTTDRAMEEVFRAIREFDWVETEYIHLADYTLRHCTGCMACFGFNAPAEEPWHCYRFPEDQKREIIPKMMASDGIVLGTPVYGCGATALLRMLIEMTPLGTTLSRNMRGPCGIKRSASADASGAFRSGPRAQTEALLPFFQNAKRLPNSDRSDSTLNF